VSETPKRTVSSPGHTLVEVISGGTQHHLNKERTKPAAVVTDTNRPPVYTAFPDPDVGPGQVEGTVLSSAVHRVVRAVAGGQHYSHATAPPFVPGVDGVVRLADGRRVYTGLARPPWGMLAERVAIPSGFAIERAAAKWSSRVGQ